MQGAFLPYLPGDDSVSPASEEAVRIINSDLGHLLKADAKAFWNTVQNDASLHACLDSYLRHKRCMGRNFGDMSLQWCGAAVWEDGGATPSFHLGRSVGALGSTRMPA